MTMITDGLCKTYLANGAVAAHKILKFGSTAGDVELASAATDKLIGVSTEVATTDNDSCDVFHSGIARVIAGGTIAAGDLVTANASGNAVVCNPSTGANNRYVGIAIAAAVANDIFPVLICPGIMQGA